jgi:hypothetical protein
MGMPTTLKAEEEKSLVQEAEEKVRRETPGTWEHQKAVQEEANRRTRESDAGGTNIKKLLARMLSKKC